MLRLCQSSNADALSSIGSHVVCNVFTGYKDTGGGDSVGFENNENFLLFRLQLLP